MSVTKDPTEHFNERNATLLLALLIAGDLIFIVLHIVSRSIGLHKLYSITVDGGYPEFYQYMKLFWICIFLIYASFRRASKHFFAWVLLFAYLLIDDSLRIHERGGILIANKLDFEFFLGLRRQDCGELVVAMIAGAILLVPLLWAYRNGSQIFRRISQDIVILISILLFFGVFVDILHAAIKFGCGVSFFLGLIEDGGEMLSVSLILWYVFLVAVSPRDNCGYLYNSIRLFLTRCSSRRGIYRR